MRNGRLLLLINVPDGSYKFVVDVPQGYFREPQGFLFQVVNSQIVKRVDVPLAFKISPLSANDLPPCRAIALPPPQPTIAAINVDDFDRRQIICRAESFISISSTPKKPEQRSELSTPLTVGYHYVGPHALQSNQGVWGRNYVVDATISHTPGLEQFVVERVYANDNSFNKWMEAGWAEHSTRDDRQYIYEFDTATNVWHFFDYNLSPGTSVETEVHYDWRLTRWRALYNMQNGYWAVLAQEWLNFTTADNGFNRGEIYSGDGSHPVLPVSAFDEGYLYINPIWHVWDGRYVTVIDEAQPYQCDMTSDYDQFTIYSPVVFIPSILKD